MQEAEQSSKVIIRQALDEDLGPERIDATTVALASEIARHRAVTHARAVPGGGD